MCSSRRKRYRNHWYIKRAFLTGGRFSRPAEPQLGGSKKCAWRITRGPQTSPPEQIAAAIIRKLGVHENTFYGWKKKYGGLGTPEIRELRQLREENLKLKRLVADLSLDKTMLPDVISKKW